jgi:hypothetical protein
MSIDHPIGELESRILRAMWSVESECGRRKSVVTLRYAILPMNRWDEEMVAAYYRALCNLVTQTTHADGRGDFETPTGPRYTDCWITEQGKQLLARVRSNQE